MARRRGQTVEHAHVHVIPRRKGDVPDPRGDIRVDHRREGERLRQVVRLPAPADQIRFLTNVQHLLAEVCSRKPEALVA